MSEVDHSVKTAVGADAEGDHDWSREMRERKILCEEIQGELVAAYPGLTKVEKKAKADLLFNTFATRSWTKVERFDSDVLRKGLVVLRKTLSGHETEEVST